ncbi:hypothetical protein PUR71_12995 [Streptomyces sp. SP17BM10]|uniref:hypothetical protein n=1 Tax=Streptomyces sp. SP17BM10 TaxID=3002530 RepID=UPI002E7728DD|nr:hypothetical protein [Streptomyces sp. SP17BM10]MEE1783817.1 hypothetical protein [Streptomyces sp. SP17BM10]
MQQVNVGSDGNKNPIVLVLGSLALIGLVAVVLVALKGEKGRGDVRATADSPAPAVTITGTSSGVLPTSAADTNAPGRSTPPTAPAGAANTGSAGGLAVPTSPTPAAGSPGPVCASEQPAPASNVSESACYLRDGDRLYMMASAKASTAASATVYVWLTAGNVYAYPSSGPHGFPSTTLTSTAQEFRYPVDMPLTRGVTYYVHVSSRPPGTGVPNAMNNPEVTGHSIGLRW